MSFRFSLKAILALVAVVAIVCGVLFAAPEWLRVVILFLGVLIMPGPLATLAIRSRGQARSFAIGALVAYGAWFVLVGIPGGFFGFRNLYEFYAIPLRSLGTGIPGMPGSPIVTLPSFLAYAWFYAPWLIVPIAGSISVVLDALTGVSSQERCDAVDRSATTDGGESPRELPQSSIISASPSAANSAPVT